MLDTNKRKIIVGINDSHDASACVVIDGKLICAVSEERLQRVKNMGGFPKNAIEKCLEIAEINKSEVDYVAVASNYVVFENLYNMIPSLTIADRYKIEEEYWQPILYENKEVKISDVLPNYQAKGTIYYPIGHLPFALSRELDAETNQGFHNMRKTHIAEFFGLPEDKVNFLDHHACHAYYAYYANPARKSGEDFLVLTSDAGGDRAYESVNVFRNGKFSCLSKDRENIIAKIYSYVTLLLGMKPHEHEYKVMGLSAYAKDQYKQGPYEIFKKSLAVEGIKFKRSPEVKDFFKYFKERLQGYRFDNIAGGLQDFAEEKMIEWVSNCIEHTGINNVVVSGGLGLNIKVNKRLIELPQVNSLFVPPGAGDESLSIGACYMLMDISNKDGTPNISSLKHAYLGGNSNQTEKDELLNHPLIKENYEIISDATPDQVADLLCQGEICAVFSGGMEFGPRALGNRSIIADPSKPEVVAKINECIKMRDFWMPFTPSVLSERLADYVINPKNINCSYMTISFDTTELGKKHLAAAVHPYDKTARPQRVEKEFSPVYYSIIKAFEDKTGIGAVLNTSLNIHGKPIIMTPVQIAEEILSADNVVLDNIYVEGTLLRKK